MCTFYYYCITYNSYNNIFMYYSYYIYLRYFFILQLNIATIIALVLFTNVITILSKLYTLTNKHSKPGAFFFFNHMHEFSTKLQWDFLKMQWWCQIQMPWPLSSCLCCVFLSFNRERKTGGMKLKSREGKKPRRRHTDVSIVLPP